MQFVSRQVIGRSHLDWNNVAVVSFVPIDSLSFILNRNDLLRNNLRDIHLLLKLLMVPCWANISLESWVVLVQVWSCLGKILYLRL